MGDLDQTDSFSYRYGRRSSKRKQREETSTQKPCGDVTAVNNFPRTTSLKGVESESAGQKSPPPDGGVTVVNNSSPTTSSRWLELTSYDNRLLAGYLAHEFLTKGTLFGEQYDLAGAEAVPMPDGRGRKVLEGEPNRGKAKKLKSQSYAEVASLFQSEGTHIPSIVNPAELGRWIQL